ncbi:MAG: peptidase M28, partial [Bacteroidetes bacterium]|nr:peptidase M28 [Bacteroidota bacterium]
MKKHIILLLMLFVFNLAFSQSKLQIINQIVSEVENNSQLENLAHELMDQIGPRLTGTPQMLLAHDWVVNTYTKWDINAENEQFGQWRAWERGISHIDMMSPWVKSLEGQQLSWSASTKKNGELGEVVLIPYKSKEVFDNWL